jgi:hypothetical protein
VNVQIYFELRWLLLLLPVLLAVGFMTRVLINMARNGDRRPWRDVGIFLRRRQKTEIWE